MTSCKSLIETETRWHGLTIHTVFPHIRPAGIIILHSLQMRVLLENTTFLLHKIVRIAGIIRVAGNIRGRALYIWGNTVVPRIVIWHIFLEMVPNWKTCEIKPIPTRLCHVIYCCGDKSYPCLVGIGLIKEELTSQDLLGLSHL